MHIDNTYLTNRTLGQADPSTQAAAAGKGAASGPAPSADSSHVPSAELLALLALVRQATEVRPDVLQRVAERLANGYYLTRDAAARTAAAIQQAQE